MAKVIASPSINSGKYRTLQRAGTDEGTAAAPDTASHESHGRKSVGIDEYERMRSGLLAQLETESQRANQAEEALKQYEAQLGELRLAAQQDGVERGLKQALVESEKTLNSQIESLSSVFEKLAAQKRQLFADEAEKVAVEIGFHAAAKIVGLSATDRKLVEAIVETAMESVADKSNLIVRLSPADYERLTLADNEKRLSALTGVDLRSDRSIQFGGCIMESSGGMLDARLELQLEAIKQALLDAYSSQSVQG